MENIRKTSWILLWTNLVGVFLYGLGHAMINYLNSSHQGTVGAWQFLFAVIGLCLFGYGLLLNHEDKGAAKHSAVAATAWLSVAAGVLGFIFAFVPNNALGIVTAIVAVIAFICAIVIVRK